LQNKQTQKSYLLLKCHVDALLKHFKNVVHRRLLTLFQLSKLPTADVRNVLPLCEHTPADAFSAH